MIISFVETAMPFCPNCKYEYRPGFTKCPDCDVELVDKLPKEAEASEALFEWVDLVCIGIYPNDLDAQAACATLRSQGIKATVQKSTTARPSPGIMSVYGGVRLNGSRE
jgi:hypothetical protein